jgi:hypothetical protein
VWLLSSSRVGLALFTPVATTIAWEVDHDGLLFMTGGLGCFRLTKGGSKAMCETCVEIDQKIEHYRRLSAGITDRPMLDEIKKLTERMQAQKAALHPEKAK